LRAFDELLDFIEHGTRMSHIYQPFPITTLAKTGGTVTLHQVAMALLDRDENQIPYYEVRNKKMPLPYRSPVLPNRKPGAARSHCLRYS